MEIAVCVWLICGVGAAAIANSKGRSVGWWFVIGVLIGPLALLIVGFMAPAAVQAAPPVATIAATSTPSRPTPGGTELGILYSDSTIRISRERITYQGNEYTIKSLKPVSVHQAGQGHYVIDVYNIMDRRVLEIGSSSTGYLEQIASAINRAIELASPSPTPVLPVNPTALAPAGPPPAPNASDDRVKLLTELKQLLDASLITQAEYEAKKAEILGRM